MGCTKLTDKDSSQALENNDLYYFLGIDNTPYRFNGKELDPETGNQYYGARYYDPKISVWLSVDPIFKTHESAYSAFSCNPIMIIDPDGRDTSFADDQARKDFNSALNIVKSNVSNLEDRVNENNSLANKEGFKASVKRLFRNEKSDERKLENWKKLESDFDKTTDQAEKMVKYSSTGVKPGANGTTQEFNKHILVKVRPGKLSAYIHENRHVNQIYNGTTGSKHNTDWFDELDAFQYQMIFNSADVYEKIQNSAKIHGDNTGLYGLRDMIKNEYKKGYIWSFKDHK